MTAISGGGSSGGDTSCDDARARLLWRRILAVQHVAKLPTCGGKAAQRLLCGQ